MRLDKKIVKIGILFFIVIGIISKKSAYALDKKEVLFISSNNPGFVTFNDQVNGLKDSLGEDIQLQIEYMDLRAFSTMENEWNFYNLLKYKLSNYRDFSSVVLGDDEALAFAVKYRNELFKDIPIVFFGVSNDELIEEALKMDNVFGVNEIESVHENIALIKKFHKDVKNIVFLDRYDEKWRTKKFLEECEKLYTEYNFKSINTREFDLENMDEITKEITKDDAVLMFYPVNFKEEKVSTYDEVSRLIYNTTKVPIYNIISYGIGAGSIGGKTISHFNQGKEAGRMAKNILLGEKNEQRYIAGEAVNQYIFDYNRLKDFNIKEKDLPSESIILNKPLSFWEQYKTVIIPTSILLLGLFSIIIALIFFIVNRIKYTKELLKAKQLAEEISQSKGHFISNISHELRTPVSVIMSAIQLIKLKIDNNKSNYEEIDINNNLSIINQNCYRLLRLINNIIDTAKIEGGFMDFKLININTVELVESIVQSAVPYAETKGLSIVFDTSDEEIYTTLDPNKIDRIILNLLSNAIKFSHKGGIIEVNIEKIEEKVRISVKDSGIGIEEENLDKIFEKFVQVDESFMRRNEGSGIGLSIVKSFVNMHKGDIYVKSELGKGSEFIIELPIKTLDELKVENHEIKGEKDSLIVRTQVEFSDIYF